MGNNNTNTTYSGVLSGSGSLVKIGSGTLTLANTVAQTYSGATTVQAGVLALAGTTNMFSPVSDVFITGGTLNASAYAETLKSLTIGSTGELNLSNTNLLTITGSAGFAGTLNISGTITTPELLMTYGTAAGFSGQFTTLNNNGTPLLADHLTYSGGSVEVVAGAAGPNIWTATGGGSWNVGTNWSNIVPPVAATGAVFPFLAAAQTVTLDAAQSVGTMQFSGSSGSSSYKLSSSGTNTLTLNNSGSGATIAVTSGTDTIAAPVVLADNLAVSGSGTLVFGSPAASRTTARLRVDHERRGRAI